MGLQTFTSRSRSAHPPRGETSARGKQNGFFSTFKSMLRPTPDINTFRGPYISKPQPLYAQRKPHPIHRLPYEILALVFVVASEEDPMISVVASHTCRAWRAIALHTPRLWTHIDIDDRERMWATRIHRAKACPLHIRIRSPVPRRRNPGMMSAEAVQRRMYFVLPYMHRWESLDVKFTKYAPLLWNAALSECCSARLRSRATILVDLTLIHPHNDDSKEFLLFGGYAPGLRRVTLDGIHLLWHPSLFHNLTYLDYTHHGFTSGLQAVEDVVYMLQVSCHLQELSLMFRRKHSASTSSSHPRVSVRRRIRLPHLITLRFKVNTSDIPMELRHVASLIRTPALQSLSFVDVRRRRVCYPGTPMFFQQYAFPNTLQSLRRDKGWCEDNVNVCLEPHIFSVCPHRHLAVNSS